MLEIKNYYISELEKLGNIKRGYPAKIKITHENGETKWLGLNDESATEIVKFLSENFKIGE